MKHPVEKPAGDGVARKEADTRRRQQEERRPEERDGVVDSEPERGDRQTRRGGRRTPSKAAGDESEEAQGWDAAEAVEDEGVGDVERAGDEQAEGESFGEAAQASCQSCGRL